MLLKPKFRVTAERLVIYGYRGVIPPEVKKNRVWTLYLSFKSSD